MNLKYRKWTMEQRHNFGARGRNWQMVAEYIFNQKKLSWSCFIPIYYGPSKSRNDMSKYISNMSDFYFFKVEQMKKKDK